MFASLVRSSLRKLLKGRVRTSPAPAQLPADELNPAAAVRPEGAGDDRDLAGAIDDELAHHTASITSIHPRPREIDTVELGLLMGNENSPTFETEREFVRDVQRWKVWLTE